MWENSSFFRVLVNIFQCVLDLKINYGVVCYSQFLLISFFMMKKQVLLPSIKKNIIYLLLFLKFCYFFILITTFSSSNNNNNNYNCDKLINHTSIYQ